MVKNPRLIEMAGLDFGLWTVIEQAGNNPGGGALWLCRCACGVGKKVLGSDLRRGASVSCGCQKSARLSEANRTHGGHGSRLYETWRGMRQRCGNPRAPSYKRYGGVGITVCDQWHDFSLFKEWAEANGYADDLTIERRENASGYSPDNCEWATRRTQARNRRNVLKREDGALWSDIAISNGISAKVFGNRVSAGGWTNEDAATIPMGGRRSKAERNPDGSFERKAVIAWRRKKPEGEPNKQVA